MSACCNEVRYICVAMWFSTHLTVKICKSKVSCGGECVTMPIC